MPKETDFKFQSPQWGSNSKEGVTLPRLLDELFQSPQWGSNSKEEQQERAIRTTE